MAFPGIASIRGTDGTEHEIGQERFYSKSSRWNKGPNSKHFDRFAFNPSSPGGKWARLGLANAPARHFIRMTAAFKLKGPCNVFLVLYDVNLNNLNLSGASQKFGVNYWASGGVYDDNLTHGGMSSANGIPLNADRNTASLYHNSAFQPQISIFKETNGWTGIRTSMYYYGDGDSSLTSEMYVSMNHDISKIYAVGIQSSNSLNFSNMEINAEYW